LVYLAQAAGLRGRYSYGWYVYGPYSPALTQDYFRLQEHVGLSPDALEDMQNRYELSPQVEKAMTSVKDLMQVPPDLGDDRLADWLELLASYHFLRTRSGADHAKATEILRARKPHVSDYADLAREHLASRGFIPT
jgi:hypothetical protein